MGVSLTKRMCPEMNRNKQNLTIPVRLDSDTFQKFAIFDNMTRKQLWRRPVTQGLLLIAAGCICMALGGLKSDVAFITYAFWLLGAAMIVLYLLTFWGYVRQQVKKPDKESDDNTFSISVGDAGMSISTSKKFYNFTWSEMTEVYRAKDAMYIYTEKAAYIIPQGNDAKALDAVWERFTEKMDPKRIADLRKKDKK